MEFLGVLLVLVVLLPVCVGEFGTNRRNCLANGQLLLSEAGQLHERSLCRGGKL